MKTVATYSMPAETHVPLSRLHDAGIDAVARDDATLQLNWMWSNALGGVKIDVPDDQADVARALLDSEPSEDGVLVCPHCGSHDLAVAPLRPVSALALLIAQLPLPSAKVRVHCRDCGRTHDVRRIGVPTDEN
ncbi:DUF2007 domain-containing protein [Actomonas aquatica]|uniref:DUF2007 domain-containing protein n=1 Tax=Actomonas aquatica TaxID=2866162 RepID=A0ABZ1C7G2_9BACT|nr:DUF2007 domain-containing protein [Opitutus sp. WL0086]WRQ87441.1 DUF2007 domain-containing protein [Opitutus sp. WL0086]